MRGNHDAYQHQDAYAGDQWIELPGLVVALLDTAIPGETTGQITTEQLEWLDDRTARSDRPVLVMGHHQQWIAGQGGSRSDDYFGLHPDSSDALDELCVRRTAVLGYAAGHTHRHRVRPMTRAGVPSIEVGCTKDFPGTWAEYRVFDGGVMQVVHRMSSEPALEWSESCRHLYADFGIDYEGYARVRSPIAASSFRSADAVRYATLGPTSTNMHRGDVHDRCRHRLHPLRHAAVRLTGYRGRRVVTRRVVLRLDWRPELCTSGGLMHGGVLMALADSAGGVAFVNLPEGAKRTATIESKTNFLGAVMDGTVIATATPLHVGSTTIVMLCSCTWFSFVCVALVGVASKDRVLRGCTLRLPCGIATVHRADSPSAMRNWPRNK